MTVPSFLTSCAAPWAWRGGRKDEAVIFAFVFEGGRNGMRGSGVSVEEAFEGFDGIGHFVVVRRVAADQALTEEAVEGGEDAVPAMVHIEEHHGLATDTDHGGSHHGEHFVERADASGKSHKDVALAIHHGLAVIEVDTAEIHVNGITDETAFDNDVGHHAIHTATAALHCLRQHFHQSLAGTAVDERAASASDELTQLTRGLRIGSRKVGFGGKEYTYFL